MSCPRPLGLRRSDGTAQILTPGLEMFAATIGGLGLTGIIGWVELQLMPLASAEMDYENLRFAALEDFFDLSGASADWGYVVAWLDCLSPRGRGIFSRARHAADGSNCAPNPLRARRFPLPRPPV